jgi:hypothetical protein
MSLIRGKIQTDILAIEVAVAAAIWKEGEKDPNWVKRDASGRFSKKAGTDTDSGDEKQIPTESKKSLRELAQKQKKIVQDSISNTLERLGLKEKVDKKELEKITELIKPESSSTPEGLQTFTDKLGKMYNDLEKKWEEQPATAKVLVGAMGAAASVVLLHSGIKNASKAYEGIKGFKKADDELRRLNEEMQGYIKWIDEDLIDFTGFHRAASFSALNENDRKKYEETFEAVSEMGEVLKKFAAEFRHQGKKIKSVHEKVTSTYGKEGYNLENKKKIDTLSVARDKAEEQWQQTYKKLEELEKSTKAAKTMMYAEVKDNATRIGATQGDKDFLNYLDEFISRTKTREEQFGDFIDSFWDARKPSPSQSLKNKKEANLDYLKGAAGDTIGCIAGLMLVGEASAAALLSAAQDIIDEKNKSSK